MLEQLARLIRRRGGDDRWSAWARDHLRPWHALPAGIAATALVVMGFWLGGFVGGGHAASGAITSTVQMRGHVITVDGVHYLSTPARTVHIQGRTVRIPASTRELTGTQIADRIVSRTINVPVTVATTVPTTVIQTVTVTGPVTTVTGPTTTVLATVTVPVISTITVSIP